MAEVSQRLGNGAYRLTVLRTSHGRLLSTGGGPGYLSVSCASSHRGAEDEPARDLSVRSLSNSRATRRRSQKLSRVRKTETQQKDATLLYATSFGLASSPFAGPAETRESLQGCTTTLYVSAGLLQEKMLSCRMSSWTRRAVSIHPDTFTSIQQVRAVCTVIFILAEQGSERPRLKGLKFHPDTWKVLKTTARGYSFRSEEPPLHHKSRTAYYDVLKVSPGATQSQIKTAYYKQSFIYHPDKNPGSKEATQRFSEISEAYTVLGNISLRRKYDRGILNQSDIQSAGRPSSKDTTSKSTKSQQQQRARQFSKVGGKPMFDFDAFYQAHYGEQLQREREMRARKQHLEEMQQKKKSRWREQKVMELALTMAVAMAGLILVSISKPWNRSSSLMLPQTVLQGLHGLRRLKWLFLCLLQK